MNNEKRLDISKEIKKEELNKLTVLDKIDYLSKRGYFVIKNPNFEGPDESTAPISVLRSSIPIENAARFEEDDSGIYTQFKVFDASGKLIGTVTERKDGMGYNYSPESTSKSAPNFNIGDYVEGLELLEEENIVRAVNIKSKKKEIININLSSRFKEVISKVLNNEKLDPDSMRTLSTFLRAIKKEGFIQEDVDTSLSEFKEDNKKQCENIIKLSLI